VNHWTNWRVSQGDGFNIVSQDVVTDTNTGLTWQRKVAMDTSNGSCKGAVQLTWDQAVCYCASLSLPGKTSGWRLPSRSELMSIVRYDASPAINSTVFPGTPSGVFWTSSPEAGTEGAWEIQFSLGSASTNGDKSQTNFVRCVQGETAAPAQRYTVGTGALAGTVLDNATKLRWQKAPMGPSTQAQLKQACESSTLGQLTWRMPTMDELTTTVDETTSNPAFDTTVFDGGSDDYLSSSTLAIGFWWGQSEVFGSAGKAYTRCVTGG
jgi:hypothetical protein